jgi:mRNA interferase YafQ
MLRLITNNRFEREREKAKKRGKDMRKLTEVVTLLLEEKLLPVKYKNHKLQGDYIGYWECYVQPDWLLVYRKAASEIILARTGSHSDLF